MTAQAEETVPFAITIRHISCVDDCEETGLEGFQQRAADFYAKVFINGVKQPPGSSPDTPSTPITEDDPSVDPFWTVSTDIPASVVNVPVAIQIWDSDLGINLDGDDLGDASPLNDDNTLDFRVDRRTGKWIDPTGRNEVTWPQNCYTGDGGDDDEPRVKVCFDIGGDIDGDGLVDSWERPVSEGGGYDDNGDGVVDVDLNALGANPECKDLFLEVDEATNLAAPNAPLTRADIQAMKAAFASAPKTAGSRAAEREGGAGVGNSEDTFGTNAPPDRPGCRGINLHVDAGGLVDATAREGQVAGTCFDGVDNGGGGLIDGADPDCSGISGGVETHLESGVEDPVGPPTCANGINDDGDTRPDGTPLTDGADPDCLVGDPVFAAAGRGGGGSIPAPGACGVDGSFFAAKNSYIPANPTFGLNPVRRFIFRYAIHAQLPSCPRPTGGQGELGGNDFISFNAGAGTLMHELGHTLNLFHGGGDHEHCKPNFVSVMNYNTQFGIPRNTGGTILDYSPPRIALDGTTRGMAPLPTLDEDELDENTVLDPTDTANQFVFTNEGNADKRMPLSQNPNWNGDTDPPFESSVEDVNINDDGADGTPGACDNDSDDELKGADDWSFVSLSFHSFGEADDAAINPETEDVPTTQDLVTMWRSLNTTNLSVAVSDAPDPVAAGTDLVYTVTVTNHGPNPADSVRVVQTLPAGTTYQSDTAGCRPNGQMLTCDLGHIAASSSRTFTVTVEVAADLVYRNGGPTAIASTAVVSNLAGPDSSMTDNTATATTRVIAVADVRVAEVAATSPLEVLIGQAANSTLNVGIDNIGPSSPIDTVLTTTASATPGVTVTPVNSISAQNALAVGSPRTVPFNFSLDCTSPGVKSVTLSTRLALKNAVDVDPDLTNNERSTSFQIDCVVPIVINVRPGQYPNSINLNTDATLAALTTRAGEYGLPVDSDATTIDVSRTLWGLRSRLFNVAMPTGAEEIHGLGHPTRSYELDERTRDADTDLVLHFKPADSGLTLSSTEACLKGKYLAPDGNTYTFFGCDSVRVVN